MRKLLLGLTIFTIMTFCDIAYANWYQDIINAINAQGGITNGFLSNMNTQQGQILASQQDIENLMKEVHGSMIGNFGWGTYNVHDYQSYGSGAENWSSVMSMTGSGSGSGALGQVVNNLSSQFPINTTDYNKGVTITTNQQYYAVKSQTVLAARAASQLDYDNIQNQIAYQQMLQQQIEKATDLKSAIDLSNRIQVEGNLINLAILRQAALSNQQQSITEQANINSALSNAKFLTK